LNYGKVGNLPEGRFLYGAANRVRTGDIHVGNVMLYQLSYSRT